MTYSARSSVDEVRERLDIVEVISSTVSLQRSGRNFKARCPFHAERTPSFFVFPERGTWHCFGACATGGDVFTFVMRQEGVPFGEALRILAARAGVTLPERSAESEEENLGRNRIREALAAAAQYYHHLLIGQTAGARAKSHLEERGLTRETWDRFILGASPDAWTALTQYLLGQGYAEEELESGGLVIRGDNGQLHDRFRGRLMIPIRDLQGHVVGFGARTLDPSGKEQPKYTNSPQTALFDKSGLLYGLDLAREAIRRAGSVVLVEGYMDVLMAHQESFANVVASMGTSITERQVRSLKRYTHNLVLALDSDAAGDLATLRGIEVASQALDTTSAPTLSWRGLVRYRSILDGEVRILRLPAEKDPDEIIQADPNAWQELQANALPMVDYVIEAVLVGAEFEQPQAKTAAADRVLPLIAGLSDPVQQSHYLQRLGRRLQVSESALQQRLRALQPSRGKSAKGVSASEEKPVIEADRSVEEHCLALLLHYPALRAYAEQIPPELFRYTEHRVLLSAVIWNKMDPEALIAYDDPALEALAERVQQRGIPPMNDEEALKALEMTVRGLDLKRLRQRELALAALFDAAEEARSEDDEAAEHLQRLHEQGMADAVRLRALWSDAKNSAGFELVS